MSDVRSDDPVRLLKRAKTLVRKGWTQGPEAVTKRGRGVSPLSPAACKWCLWGAVQRAECDTASSFDAYQQAWDALYNVTERHPIDFNEEDGRKKFEVLAKIDGAIEHLREMEAT